MLLKREYSFLWTMISNPIDETEAQNTHTHTHIYIYIYIMTCLLDNVELNSLTSIAANFYVLPATINKWEATGLRVESGVQLIEDVGKKLQVMYIIICTEQIKIISVNGEEGKTCFSNVFLHVPWLVQYMELKIVS